MSYRGKTVTLLTDAEIINNSVDTLLETGVLEDRYGNALLELGVFESEEQKN